MNPSLITIKMFLEASNKWKNFSCVTGPVNDGTVGVGTVCSSTKPFQFCFKSDGQEAYQNDAPLTEVDHGGTAAAPTPHGTRGFQIRKKKGILLGRY